MARETAADDDRTASALAAASAAVGLPLTDPVDLGGSERSLVLRARGADRDDETVVVKQFLPARGDGPAADTPDGYVRELVGLRTLDAAPDLLAHDDASRLLVMTDAGTWPTLADLLLAPGAPTDRDRAWAESLSWAGTLGRTVAESASRASHVRRLLDEHGARDEDVAALLSRGAHALDDLAGGTADDDRARLDDEVARMAALFAPGAADVVSPTDTCPDNALRTPSGWTFLDLEGTSVHHLALDAAYTLLPFATCWCVFDAPHGYPDALLEAFEDGARPHLPGVVDGAGWRTEVLTACGAYVLAAGAWLLASAHEDRPTVGPEGRSPSYRELLVQRWRWGSAHLRDELPATAALCAAALHAADERWGGTHGPGPYRAFSRTTPTPI
ncbi:hypothetical protein GCM10025864_07450 [Luteimicrobium album]|uniref:Aminoglycoside phosphotransferase domain-containing protein n=1 Tax=Luteimicrobium album TaxID=1054550 RepID=A0ABQ6HX05_9MICO|nr:hypothetical protein [Luteimicrobium album]GMA22986.1 hypothetical protein GCM10025864_07450 [Luteimicrobium album]